jgi:hypothetical protein
MKRSKKSNVPVPPAPIPVTITVNNGNFTYTPTLVRVHHGDTIAFSCPTGPFELVFKHQSPGDKLFVSTAEPNLTILSSAPYAIYHYAAAVYDPDVDKVFIDAGCGDVGVET